MTVSAQQAEGKSSFVPPEHEKFQFPAVSQTFQEGGNAQKKKGEQAESNRPPVPFLVQVA